MKKMNFKIFSLLIAGLAFTSCEKLEVEAPISPDNYPEATIVSDYDGTEVNEGTVITYTITLDKMMESAITFDLVMDEENSTVDSHDVEYHEVTIPPYTLEGKMEVKILADDDPETTDDSFAFQIAVTGLGERYNLKPGTSKLDQSFVIKNQNDPTFLTVKFGWDTDSDIDILTYSDTPVYPETLWGTGGATGSNPEYDTSIWLADPVGTYYVCVLDWGEPGFNYKFTIGYPDQSVEIIEGTFDNSMYDFFVGPVSWGSPNAYKVLKVENDGSKFVVTEM